MFYTHERPYRLYAKTEEEMRRWISVINEVIQGKVLYAKANLQEKIKDLLHQPFTIKKTVLPLLFTEESKEAADSEEKCKDKICHDYFKSNCPLQTLKQPYICTHLPFKRYISAHLNYQQSVV
jgi:hypothetical protein